MPASASLGQAPWPTAASAPRDDAEPPRFDGIVTVAHRFHPFEAELLRGRLCADGIPAVLADAHTVQTDTLLTAALGGVRVMVPAGFEAEARRTIAALEGGAFALADDDAAGDDDAPPAVSAPPRRATLAAGAAALLVAVGLLVAFARPIALLH